MSRWRPHLPQRTSQGWFQTVDWAVEPYPPSSEDELRRPPLLTNPSTMIPFSAWVARQRLAAAVAIKMRLDAKLVRLVLRWPEGRLRSLL
jgi:hypothetical protein